MEDNEENIDISLQRGSEVNLEDNHHLIKPLEVRGLTIPTATLFIIGQAAGGGTVAVPNGLANTGWIGVALMVLGAVGNAFMAIVVSKCYLILLTKDSQFTGHVRDPYTNLIGKALGGRVKTFSSVLLHTYIISTTTVYLLIAAEMASGFFHYFVDIGRISGEFRIWILIFALIIIPLTFFGTPKEFWGLALLAVSVTTIPVLMIISRLALQHTLEPINIRDVTSRMVTWRTFFSGFGTIVFAMAGVPLYPTLIADMKVKQDFPKAAVFGYIGISLIYFPLALYSNVLLGKDMKPNVVTNLMLLKDPCYGCQTLVPLIQMLLGLHFIFGYLLVLNPLSQEVEEFVGIPKHFCWQRCVLRSLLVLGTFVLAEAIPKFGIIVSLIGGTVITILTFILPVLAYLKLQEDISLHMKVVLVEVIGVSIILCVGSLYSSTLDVIELY